MEPVVLIRIDRRFARLIDPRFIAGPRIERRVDIGSQVRRQLDVTHVELVREGGGQPAGDQEFQTAQVERSDQRGMRQAATSAGAIAPFGTPSRSRT